MSMFDAAIYRYDVAFEAAEIEQGRPMVRLVLSRERKASASTTVFLFEPREEMTSQATDLLARFLNEYIAHFTIVPPDLTSLTMTDTAEQVRLLIDHLRT
jgi:hypothetical protein